MTQRPLLALFTLCSLYACGEVSVLGNGTDSGDAGEGGTSGYGGEGTDDGTGGSEAGTATGGAMATGGANAGRGGVTSDAGRGGRPSSGGGAGMGGIGGSSAGSGASAGVGMMPGMGGTGPSCQVSTMDTKQGDAPPPADDCPEIGAALLEGHDAALDGRVLDVAPLVGTWADGSGADRVELVLDAQGAGTLLFGEPGDFPTITDPNEPFLSSVGERDASLSGLEHLRPHLGFGHTVIADNGRGSEMSFHILVAEAWEEWCALQSPVQSAVGRDCYTCEYDAGLYSLYPSCAAQSGCFAGDHDPDEANRVHCGRFELCLIPYQRVCACTAHACFANLEIQGQLAIYPFSVTLDPVDTTVLRLASLSEILPMTTHYLEKQN